MVVLLIFLNFILINIDFGPVLTLITNINKRFALLADILMIFVQ